jgi:FkbM family methyltransferase
VETIWGRFYLIPNYFSLTIVSPAFERPDMDELIHLMKISLDHKKRVLFIDVGAFIGTYTIGVSTRLNAYDAFHTISIEPDPVNYALLQRNLRLNKIKRNTSFNVGLAAKNSVIREKSLYDTYISIKDKPRYRFTFKRLDDLLTTKEVQTFDEVYIKIDIEGHEQEALEGAKKIMKSSKKVILMVEDCIDDSIISYLKKRMIFLYRRSPYNSFWSSK